MTDVPAPAAIRSRAVAREKPHGRRAVAGVAPVYSL